MPTARPVEREPHLAEAPQQSAEQHALHDGRDQPTQNSEKPFSRGPQPKWKCV